MMDELVKSCVAGQKPDLVVKAFRSACLDMKPAVFKCSADTLAPAHHAAPQGIYQELAMLDVTGSCIRAQQSTTSATCTIVLTGRQLQSAHDTRCCTCGGSNVPVHALQLGKVGREQHIGYSWGQEIAVKVYGLACLLQPHAPVSLSICSQQNLVLLIYKQIRPNQAWQGHYRTQVSSMLARCGPDS